LEETSGAGRSSLVRLEETLAGTERERSNQARSLARGADAAARLATVAARLRGISQVARERRRGLVGQIEQAAVQRTSLDRETDRLVHELEEATVREQDAGLQVEATEATLRASEEQLRPPPAQEDTDPVMLRDDLRSLEAAAARDTREFSKLTELLEGTRARTDADRSRAGTLGRELDRIRERIAAAGPFLMGEKISIADILFMSCLDAAQRYELAVPDFLRDYRIRMRARPAYAETYPINYGGRAVPEV
jgi:chromosome segregation ATPase